MNNFGYVVLGFGGRQAVDEYAGWSIAGWLYDGVSFTLAEDDYSRKGMFFSPDGLKLVVLGRLASGDDWNIKQYSLSVAWDLSTITYDSVNLNIHTEAPNATDFYISADGTRLFVTAPAGPGKGFQYTLSTAWDLATAAYDNVEHEVHATYPISYDPRSLTFSQSGDTMYVADDSGDRIYQSSLSTPWSLASGVTDGGYTGMTIEYDTSIAVDPIGGKLFILNNDATEAVEQYSVDPPGDISGTVIDDGVPLDVSGQTSNPTGMAFKSDGSKLYVLDGSSGVIHQYGAP